MRPGLRACYAPGMVPVVTLVLIAWLMWRGAPLAGGVGLMVLGLGVHLVLMLRFAGATAGGVGGHAEWVRETSTRPRLARHPAWLVGLGLIGAGLGWALAG